MPEITREPRELSDYGHSLRRRWPWLVIGALLGAVLGLGYLHVAPKTYTATSDVLVQSASTDTSTAGARTNGSTVNLDTEAQLVTSTVVATQAQALLNSSRTPEQLAGDVVVSVPANTAVLDIKFSASSPDAARAGAEAFAQAYLNNRFQTDLRFLNSETKRLTGLVNQQRAALQQIEAKLTSTTPPTPSQVAQLRSQRVAVRAQLSGLTTQLTAVQGKSLNSGQIIGAAQTPKAAANPKPFLVLPGAVLVGLLAGLLFAALLERRDHRLHRVSDIQRLTGIAVAGVLPAAALRSLRPGPEMRALYHALATSDADRAECWLVSGSPRRLAADGLARQLAIMGNRVGRKVALLQRPQAMASAAAVALSPATLATEQLDFESMGAVSDQELNPRALSAELAGLRAHLELVVLAPPTNDPMVDLPSVAPEADAVIIVVELHNTSRDVLAAMVQELTEHRATRVCAVALRPDKRRVARKEARLARSAVPLRTPPATPAKPAGIRGAEVNGNAKAVGEAKAVGDAKATPSTRPQPARSERSTAVD